MSQIDGVVQKQPTERNPGSSVEAPRIVEGFGGDDGGCVHGRDRAVGHEYEPDDVAGSVERR